MIKKIFTIAIALSALGLILGGCSQPAAEPEKTPTTGDTAGGGTAGGETAGTEAPK